MVVAKAPRTTPLVIRVAIPIDVGTVVATRSSVFAHATPMRVERLIALAVVEAIGARSPADKRERAIRTTLAGLRDGRFRVEIDGRAHDDPDAIVVCERSATLRFFSTRAQRARRSPNV